MKSLRTELLSWKDRPIRLCIRFHIKHENTTL
jgi:hypothetical protein